MRLSQLAGFGLLLFMFANMSQAVAQDTWSLQRCVDYALQHNIQVKQQDVQKRLSELTLKQSQLSQIPNLNGNASAGWSTGRVPSPQTNTYINSSIFQASGGLTAQSDIFNWFSKTYLIQANKYDARSNSFLMDKARNDLAFNVATAFLQILLNNEQLKVNQVQVKQTISNLENTKKLVIAGSVPESNQADLEAQLATDSTNLVTAQNQVILSILQVKALLNLGFDIPFQPEIPENIATLPLARLDEMAPEMVYSAALTSYPLLMSDEMRIASARKNFKSVRAQLYPSFSLAAGVTTNYSNASTLPIYGTPYFRVDTIGRVVNNNYKVVDTSYHVDRIGDKLIPFGDQLSNTTQQYIQLTMRVPLFNGWQARTNAAKAKLNVQNMELTREADRQKLRQDIYTAHANAVAAMQKFIASSKGVDAAQKAYDFATKRFNIGLMNTIDYITTQSKLFTAQINKVSAQYDYIFKMKLLEFYRDQKISL
ncbi:TolC family protein [Chitinophaga vietnamensis]|uniref:TolC family protein n=1 Tax=Chitinophaga vietnamensis TaxID=2593957 RepID=UPI001375F98B|nr:TolC family protein [Chitinophaga vietnamensis]